MDRATIDHRGPAFAALFHELLSRLRRLFRTEHPVLVFPASGSGGWEAALVNTLSPGDRVLGFEHGAFAAGWNRVAGRLGLEVERVECDWREPIPLSALEQRLAADAAHRIRAVCVVHNETSTGVTNPVSRVRERLDRAGHPALLLVDVVSSLGSIEYRHDDWGVDVAVCGSQKGLMLPPGLALLAVSEKALSAHADAGLPRAFWDWSAMLEANRRGFFPWTPPTNLLFGLRESLALLEEEGAAAVAARHRALAGAARAAVDAWGLEHHCRVPEARSDTVTAVLLPAGSDAEALRRVALERFDLSLGAGLGPLAGSVFRIGHLGSLNELMLAGALCGVEMSLALCGIPHRPEGVRAALTWLSGAAGSAAR